MVLLITMHTNLSKQHNLYLVLFIRFQNLPVPLELTVTIPTPRIVRSFIDVSTTEPLSTHVQGVLSITPKPRSVTGPTMSCVNWRKYWYNNQYWYHVCDNCPHLNTWLNYSSYSWTNDSSPDDTHSAFRSIVFQGLNEQFKVELKRYDSPIGSLQTCYHYIFSRVLSYFQRRHNYVQFSLYAIIQLLLIWIPLLNYIFLLKSYSLFALLQFIEGMFIMSRIQKWYCSLLVFDRKLVDWHL